MRGFILLPFSPRILIGSEQGVGDALTVFPWSISGCRRLPHVYGTLGGSIFFICFEGPMLFYATQPDTCPCQPFVSFFFASPDSFDARFTLDDVFRFGFLL